jgi:hypothetical protein
MQQQPSSQHLSKCTCLMMIRVATSMSVNTFKGTGPETKATSRVPTKRLNRGMHHSQGLLYLQALPGWLLLLRAAAIAGTSTCHTSFGHCSAPRCYHAVHPVITASAVTITYGRRLLAFDHIQPLKLRKHTCSHLSCCRWRCVLTSAGPAWRPPQWAQGQMHCWAHWQLPSHSR